MASLLLDDSNPVIWWGSPVECLSALYRRRRSIAMDDVDVAESEARLRDLMADVHSVLPSEPVRSRAGRLLAVHDLRAADALQLAAALIWVENDPGTEGFVCLDERLNRAARLEGFSIYPGPSASDRRRRGRSPRIEAGVKEAGSRR